MKVDALQLARAIQALPNPNAWAYHRRGPICRVFITGSIPRAPIDCAVSEAVPNEVVSFTLKHQVEKNGGDRYTWELEVA